MNTDKLVETLNQLLSKTGGEAARIWPLMVQAWVQQSYQNLVIFTILTVGCWVVAGFLVHQARSHEDEAARVFSWIGAVALVGIGFAFLQAALSQLTDLSYPEATLLYRILTSHPAR